MRFSPYLNLLQKMREKLTTQFFAGSASVAMASTAILTAVLGNAHFLVKRRTARHFFRAGQMYRLKASTLGPKVWTKPYSTMHMSGDRCVVQLEPGSLFVVLSYELRKTRDDIEKMHVLVGEQVGWIDITPEIQCSPQEYFESCFSPEEIAGTKLLTITEDDLLL